MKKQIYLLLLLTHFCAMQGEEALDKASEIKRTKTEARWSKKQKKAFKKKLITGGFLGFVGTLVCCSLVDSSSTSQSHGPARTKKLIDLTELALISHQIQIILPKVDQKARSNFIRDIMPWLKNITTDTDLEVLNKANDSDQCVEVIQKFRYYFQILGVMCSFVHEHKNLLS